jgi:hypothetical protein
MSKETRGQYVSRRIRELSGKELTPAEAESSAMNAELALMRGILKGLREWFRDLNIENVTNAKGDIWLLRWLQQTINHCIGDMEDEDRLEL